MYGFCGWLGWEQSNAAQTETLERMVARLHPVKGSHGPSVRAVGTAIGISAHGAHEAIVEEDGYWVVAQGNPRLASSDYAALADERGLATAILWAYRERGASALELLRGGFALAIVSRRGDEALLAIDRIGGRFPLSYKFRDGVLVFSTHGASIQAHPVGRSEIDPQGIYNYLYFHMVPSPVSVRRDVRQIPPGGFVQLRNGALHSGTHWQLAYRDEGDGNLPELCEEFLRLLRRSVDLHAHEAHVGCFLSGGTDSSSVAGTLGPVSGAPARTYSIGFDAEGYDEMEYARIAAAKFETVHHEYYLKPEDVLESIPRIARAYAEPFGNASAVAVYHCARMAGEDGIQRMLAGDGGDELFAGNSRYAIQQIFGFYDRIPGVARRILEPLVFRVPENSRIMPLRKLRSYVRQAKIPMPQRMETYNYLERTGPQNIIEPDFLALVDIDGPSRMRAEVYHSTAAHTMLNRMLALDMKFIITDGDLPKVSRMCQLAGVDVAYPFLSDEMVEFSCRVPSRLKLRRLKLRWFMKHALRDFLPEQILRKKKHGFGLPFGLWMRDHRGLRDFALDNLGTLKTRKLVRAEYIDEVVHLHATDHATYYGVMIWVLVMLEQWFRTHEDGAD